MTSNRDKRKFEERLRTMEIKRCKELERLLKSIMQKDVSELTEGDKALLTENENLASELANKLERRKKQKAILEERKIEKEESPAYMRAKVAKLCSLLKAAHKEGKSVVLHTGAGLSTAAGIPDFRGPKGVWTLGAKGQAVEMNLKYEETAPTKGHMVISDLVNKGFISHVVTQNVDGLHRRSGVPPCKLSEIHGCIYLEKCQLCGFQFVQPFDVTQPQGTSFRRHKTGRKCSRVGEEQKESKSKEFCSGELVDTIVHFGESLDTDELLKAEEASSSAELAICIGTSLKVPPANKLPRLAKKLVIINLQWTALDKHTEIKINGKADEVLLLMAELLGISTISEYQRENDPLLPSSPLNVDKIELKKESPAEEMPHSLPKKRQKLGSFSFPRPPKV